jgi:pyruvate kinase
MAKLETRQALFNFQSIAAAADGIVISRGNLGLDVPPEKMALVQKSIISDSNLIGKPVIITRVVDTMCTAPRPTR